MVVIAVLAMVRGVRVLMNRRAVKATATSTAAAASASAIPSAL